MLCRRPKWDTLFFPSPLLRIQPYALHTEYAYVNWTRRFMLFHNKRPLRCRLIELNAICLVLCDPIPIKVDAQACAGLGQLHHPDHTVIQQPHRRANVQLHT